MSILLCILLLIGVLPTEYEDHLHGYSQHMAGDEHGHGDEHDHDHDDHGHDAAAELLAACDALIYAVLSPLAVTVSAAYEDGVECDYCGSWRYDDWKCDNGDHCGEGADGDCYEEHHCGYCGACEEDHELCDDCGNCLEDHCECDEKCRGCYSTSGDVCDVCGEHCTECVDFICDDCGICADCAGNELYCASCMLCIGCADWICSCGEGCSECTIGCEECREACYVCAEDEICKDCNTCFNCLGGEGNYCPECLLCKNCTDYLCECGMGCSSCVLICEQCGEKCERCADGGICEDCGTCYDCVGGEGNYCQNCDKCKFCVDQVCVGCSEGCSECAAICPECNAVCENCGDDQLCGDCGVCFECRGGEGNYCEECGLCKFCVEIVCYNGDGCSQCAYVCPDCGEKCSNCAELEMCIECNTCFECLGGEGNYCSECLLCKNCVDQVCYCGNGCSNCSVICVTCGEKCENCADDEICAECERCFDCAGGDYCAECGECIDCVEYLCSCGNGCNQCADVCEDCSEKCSACAPEELCSECGICRDCVGGEDDFCDNCSICKNCVEYICVGCSGGCSNCTEICPECGEKCMNCAAEELCTDCGVCRDCVGGDGSFCDTCSICKNCVDYICFGCGQGCSNCAVICEDCGEVCSECSDGELCVDCGICINCAGADGFCSTCSLCSECTVTCVCGEGCENCADLCPDCGEVCSNCSDEFCASCDICRECADGLFCEDCHQCGGCAEVCEDCGIVCRDCAESGCPDCGKCSGCMDEYCPDCGLCIDCAGEMCRDCHYCGDCIDNLCPDCGEICTDCADACAECGRCDACADTCPDCELCEACCADAAEALGCSHAVCPESREWLSHYCVEGGHCLGKSGKMKYDDASHWTLCGDGCNVKLNVEPHLFGEGKIKKEATKKADGVMAFTCEECGYKKEEKIPKLAEGHVHAYTDTVTEATCTEAGYTTHTCDCGHSYTDSVTPAVKHDYVYETSASEHRQKCRFCGDPGVSGPHKFGEWKTVIKAGYTFAGERQRTCTICGYAQSESVEQLKLPDDKYVVIIPTESITVDLSGGKPDDKPSDDVPGKSETLAIAAPKKEILTKGSEQTVPGLPTPPPTADGNLFDKWVDKTTGETVKKGDKLTASIELVPVWKDCGEAVHADAPADKNKDNHCDVCGYILVKESVPEETGAADTGAPEDTTAADTGDVSDGPSGGSIPPWIFIILGAFAATAVGCGTVLIVSSRKKKK